MSYGMVRDRNSSCFVGGGWGEKQAREFASLFDYTQQANIILRPGAVLTGGTQREAVKKMQNEPWSRSRLAPVHVSR